VGCHWSLARHHQALDRAPCDVQAPDDSHPRATLVLPVLVRSSAARAGQGLAGLFQGVMRAGLVACSRLQRIRTVADARFVHCASQPGPVGWYVGSGQPRLDGMRRSET